MLRECIISAYSGIYIESDDVETALRGTFLKKKKKKSCREALGAMENAEILPDLKKKKRFYGILLILPNLKTTMMTGHI